jgi:dipeptidyl aminopeptidase/acylaminoacyl peptidase
MRWILPIALSVLALGAEGRQAQQQQFAPPEIFLVPLSIDTKPAVTGAAVNITNNPDYDNQPSFLPDGSGLLFSSKRDGKQNDIYRYDLASKQVKQVTATAESEYSPLVTPDGKTFSVIRVEADGTQRLWRFDLSGQNPRLVLENVKPVGYHVWIDATHLALFILGAQGQPATLQLADTTTGKADVIESSIGRSMSMRPGTPSATFVSKAANEHWLIKDVDVRSKDTAWVSETVDQNMSEDFAWHPGGMLLMASGSKLFVRRAGNPDWREIADLATPDIKRITRLAVSPDGKTLAFVAEK